MKYWLLLFICIMIAPAASAQHFYQGPGKPEAQYHQIQGQVISLRTWNQYQHCGLILVHADMRGSGGRVIACSSNENKMGRQQILKDIRIAKATQVGTQRVRVGSRWRTAPVIVF